MLMEVGSESKVVSEGKLMLSSLGLYMVLALVLVYFAHNLLTAFFRKMTHS